MAFDRRAFAFTIAAFAVAGSGDALRNLLSWWGWGAVVILMTAWLVVEWVRVRPRFQAMPLGVLAISALQVVSVIWSAYRPETAVLSVLTVVQAAMGVLIGSALGWRALLAALQHAWGGLLLASLAFEAAVGAFVGGRLYPFWTAYDSEGTPAAFAWSRGLLFEGGRIQGVMGNANLLSMIALLGIIVAAARIVDRQTRAWGWTTIVAGVACFALSRSATVIAAAVVVAGVLVAVLCARRLAVPARRWFGGGLLALAVVALTVAWLLREPLLDLVGRSSDLTGRGDIWLAVWHLIVERPVLGWGWVSYWPPWTPPFDGLVVIRGVEYLQAHNAWLDTWLQLGALGVLVLLAYVVALTKRATGLAVEPLRTGATSALPFSATQLTPLLLVTALIVQSFAESRFLYETSWILLAAVAVRSMPDLQESRA